MARYSNTLAALAQSNPQIQSYDCDSDGHWLVTTDGFERDGGQIIHEDTVRQCLIALADTGETK